MSQALTLPVTSNAALELRVHSGSNLERALPRLENTLLGQAGVPLSRRLAWLLVLEQGLGHVPYCLEVAEGQNVRGCLPLAYVKSLLFGRFLVGLPYLDSGGPIAASPEAAMRLVDGAVALADELDVRYLELRLERAIDHAALGHRMETKAHMRLDLPAHAGALWDKLAPKVRNQVRKGQKSGLTVTWGAIELLDAFYEVYSHNMRDLGTPAYSRELFRGVMARFPGQAEFCLVCAGSRPAAAALILHGDGITQVPTAGSLRAYRETCANMLMYWQLLERAILRGNAVFDFGRSSLESNTYRFKKQWGAKPESAAWQYYVRRGEFSAMRPEHPANQRLIRVWQKLPVPVTRWIGPVIVRGIP